MTHRPRSLSVFGRSAKFVSRSVEEMFELVALSMDECLTTAKRARSKADGSKTAIRSNRTYGISEPARHSRPH
jgi:hypothetical protein